MRERSIDSVCRDFASVGDHIFVADDLFWHHPSRSLALAHELARRGIRKRWMLVQSRVDLVARHPELLEAWRPVARDFDIFFGLEAATDEGLNGLMKDATVDHTALGIDVARRLGYGVTGNFVIDPAWREADFERLWAFVDRHRLHQAGFTILTPLPGTAYFEEMRPTLRARRWAHFDMHHVLWEPALGPERFFELYCETWRRSVLNLRGRKSLWQWLREVDPRNALFLHSGAAADAAHDAPGPLSGRVRSGAAGRAVATGADCRCRQRLLTTVDREDRGIERRVGHHVLEHHQLGVAVRKRHPHGARAAATSDRATARAASAPRESASASAPSSAGRCPDDRPPSGSTMSKLLAQLRRACCRRNTSGCGGSRWRCW